MHVVSNMVTDIGHIGAIGILLVIVLAEAEIFGQDAGIRLLWERPKAKGVPAGIGDFGVANNLVGGDRVVAPEVMRKREADHCVETIKYTVPKSVTRYFCNLAAKQRSNGFPHEIAYLPDKSIGPAPCPRVVVAKFYGDANKGNEVLSTASVALKPVPPPV